MNRFIYLTLILLVSCTSVETLTSINNSPEVRNDYRFYNANSKIRYQVTNDSQKLYISLNTIEQSTIMKIFRTGFTFYFDVSGKKQKLIYFQYPLAHNGQLPGSFKVQGFSNGTRPEIDLKSKLAQISKMGVFVNADKSEQISVLSPDAEIKVSIEINNNSEITYNLAIPLNKISLKEISALSIGIVSGKLEMKPLGKYAENHDEESPGGMSGGGHPGGGRHPGGGHQGGRSEDGVEKTSLNTPIEFWFKLQLKP